MTRVPVVRKAACAAGWLLAGLGCVSPGVPDTVLPDAPIAIHYRNAEEARRRVEAWHTAAPTPDSGALASGPSLVGHKARLHADLTSLRRSVDRALRGKPASHAGRLALLHPRTRRVEVLAGPRRGALPVAWSPGHERLLYAQPEPDGAVQLHEWRRRDGRIQSITHGPDLHGDACYLADGRVVVSAVTLRGDEAVSRLRVSRPGAAPPWTPLTAGPEDHSPACSPRDAAVVFVRPDAAGRPTLWWHDVAPGAAPRRLAAGRQPRFTPDGAWLVYVAERDRDARLFRLRVDGGARAPLGRGPRNESWPAPSPDGAFVAYVAAEEAPRRHLYLRRFDGSGDRVLFSDGDADTPVW